MQELRGSIQRLVKDKGFGFIKDDSTGLEHFFHLSGVLRPDRYDNLTEGQRVMFDLEAERDDRGGKGKGKGPRAVNVNTIG